MSYTVDWKPDALEGLGAGGKPVALAIVDKNSVNDAEAEITRQLARDQFAVGSAKSEGLRRIDVRPLVAYYSVELSLRVVEVVQLGYVARL